MDNYALIINLQSIHTEEVEERAPARVQICIRPAGGVFRPSCLAK